MTGSVSLLIPPGLGEGSASGKRSMLHCGDDKKADRIIFDMSEGYGWLLILILRFWRI
jgi:predicted dinucleotide-binding enzyme